MKCNKNQNNGLQNQASLRMKIMSIPPISLTTDSNTVLVQIDSQMIDIRNLERHVFLLESCFHLFFTAQKIMELYFACEYIFVDSLFA